VTIAFFVLINLFIRFFDCGFVPLIMKKTAKFKFFYYPSAVSVDYPTFSLSPSSATLFAIKVGAASVISSKLP